MLYDNTVLKYSTYLQLTTIVTLSFLTKLREPLTKINFSEQRKSPVHSFRSMYSMYRCMHCTTVCATVHKLGVILSLCSL